MRQCSALLPPSALQLHWHTISATERMCLVRCLSAPVQHAQLSSLYSQPLLSSSTGEASAPDDYLWLMARAGYKPVIEYCGGGWRCWLSLARLLLLFPGQQMCGAALNLHVPIGPPASACGAGLCSGEANPSCPALPGTCRHGAGWRLLLRQPAAAAGALHLFHAHHWPPPRAAGHSARRHTDAQPAR